jgi:hypothetical protein
VGLLYINRSQAHECGNWDFGRAIPFWEYLFQIVGIVHLQCAAPAVSLTLVSMTTVLNKKTFLDCLHFKYNF